MSEGWDKVTLLAENAALKEQLRLTHIDWTNEATENAALRARVAECEADHPPEPTYTAWCEAGMPDVAALRAKVEELKRERDEARSFNGELMMKLVEPTRRAERAEKQLAEFHNPVTSSHRPKDCIVYCREKEARLAKVVEVLTDAVYSVGSAHIGHSPEPVHVCNISVATLARWRAALAAARAEAPEDLDEAHRKRLRQEVDR